MNSKKDLQEISKTYFDQQAKAYDTSHDGKFVKCMYEEIMIRAKALPAEKILDLGCGNGNIIKELLKVKKAQYFGADISAQMIAEAEKRVGERAQLKVADVNNLPYDNEMFDLIICNASFHHYTNPERALDEIKRVMKKGGTLILGDPTLPGALLRAIMNWGLQFGASGDYKIYGKKDMIPLFTQKGFQVRDWKWINYRTFLFNGVKINEGKDKQ